MFRDDRSLRQGMPFVSTNNNRTCKLRIGILFFDHSLALDDKILIDSFKKIIESCYKRKNSQKGYKIKATFQKQTIYQLKIFAHHCSHQHE